MLFVHSERRFSSCIVVAVLAFLVDASVFAPRLIHWSELYHQSATYRPGYPEVARAIDALHQLHDPSAKIDNLMNRVLQWRLLFPWVGYCLHMPDWLYLSLPMVGCMAVQWYVAQLVIRLTDSFRAAAMLALLSGTASWFLVSTGWLGMFDSWYILGLLIVVFSPSRVAIGFAAMLTPWVDERFVLATPLALAARSLVTRNGEQAGIRPWAVDLAIVASAIAPYLLIRFAALFWSADTVSAEHFRQHLTTSRDPWRVLDALWSGLRSLWIFVVAAVWIGLRSAKPGRTTATALLAFATLVVNLLLAFDMSRSVSCLFPLAILGAVLWLHEHPKTGTRALVACLLFNLCAPARHVVIDFDQPIRSLPYEWAVLNNPPADVSLDRAEWLISLGDFRAALHQSREALRSNPRSAEAHYIEGVCLSQFGRDEPAISSLTRAISLKPNYAAPYLLRGLLRRRQGDGSGARRDLIRALENSAPGSDEEQRIKRLLGVTSNG